ncbi:MAG: GNAT family N-acetyltransferase [Planctomycetes bacterium]|nr:GNAT family N-acetyltransferase [Planctomycetota bacterium]
MDSGSQGLPVRMIRQHLREIPAFELPAPFSLRWFRPGDEGVWTRIQRESDTLQPIPDRLFEQQFGKDPRELGSRICFVLDGSGAEIGTSAAWFGPDEAWQGWGRIHWVAMVPAMQGRGLAKPLMTVICRRMAELGHERAYLTTSTARVPAIRLYLKFGFAPDERTEEDTRAWASIRTQLG